MFVPFCSSNSGVCLDAKKHIIQTPEPPREVWISRECLGLYFMVRFMVESVEIMTRKNLNKTCPELGEVMVNKSPQDRLWDPFQTAFSWLINGGY